MVRAAGGQREGPEALTLKKAKDESVG